MLILLLIVAVSVLGIATVLIKRAERTIHDRFEWKTTALDPPVKQAEAHLVTNLKVIHYLYDWEREGWYVSSEKRTGRLDELA